MTANGSTSGPGGGGTAVANPDRRGIMSRSADAPDAPRPPDQPGPPGAPVPPDPPDPPRAVSRAVARRFFVLRHLLAPPRSLPAEADSVLRVVDRVGSLQFDPLEVAGRNHDLVLLARIDGYRRAWTEELLYDRRVLFEAYNKGLSILPMAELPWYRLTWDRHRIAHDGTTFDTHAPLVEELLGRIRDGGPLSPTDVQPRAAIDWYWRPTNQVRAVLEALAEAGMIGIARRDGNRRIYDLAERLFDADLLARRPSEREAMRHRLLSRYRGHGLLGRSGSAELFLGTGRAKSDPAHPDRPSRTELTVELVADGELVPVAIEGLRSERFIVAAEAPILEQAVSEVAGGRPPGGRPPAVAFLAPLDPFCWDRAFLAGLFDFDYVWEVYVPQARRRWGYYVLPILFGDRLVGRIEPRIDRRDRVLRILGLWWEEGFDPLADPAFAPAFAAALDAHRQFGAATRVALPRAARHRPLAAAVRAVGLSGGGAKPSAVAR